MANDATPADGRRFAAILRGTPDPLFVITTRIGLHHFVDSVSTEGLARLLECLSDYLEELNVEIESGTRDHD